MIIRSRRDFLRDAIKTVSAVGALGMMSKFGQMNAFAANPGSGYQALVCIFMTGGNDGHNTVIPISTAQQNFNLYQAGRAGMGLSQSSLLPIHNGSDVYGLHPSLPEIQGLYNAGHAAVLANVGMLVKPIDAAIYNTNNSSIIPNALFSHSDQQSQWQSSIPTGLGSTGWGGRMADLMQSQNAGATFPSTTSMSGATLFLTGQDTFAANVPGGSATLLDTVNAARAGGMQQLLTFDNGLQLVQQANDTLTRGVNYANALSAALASSTLSTQFPLTGSDGSPNNLAMQLQTVARIIKVRSTLGLSRQIFYCNIDGFDTHGGQLAIQASLLQQLSQAVLAFYQATQELGVDQNVTTFTASEFGRTLTPNGSGGTDHAWGNHHFVIGSGVQGGKFFGNFPLLSLGGSYDATGRGSLIPTTAVDQYGATLASWFGVGSANMPTIFPNIGNFSSSNLGFLA
jgi:uncharacterized protein (DUF1501 family)